MVAVSECWRPIPDWPGYEAGDRGGVRSVIGGLPYELKRGRDRKGYPTVTVCRDGKSSTKRVHVLVALAWIGRRPPGKSVRHLDGGKDNCARWNLKYGTQPQQERDKRHAGSRAKRVTGMNRSENEEKEGIETGTYRAGLITTSKTWP